MVFESGLVLFGRRGLEKYLKKTFLSFQDMKKAEFTGKTHIEKQMEKSNGILRIIQIMQFIKEIICFLADT